MQTTYSVPGMHCGHCKAAVETEVGAVSGVESVQADLDTLLVTVAGDAPADAVIAAIDDAGYEATPA